MSENRDRAGASPADTEINMSELVLPGDTNLLGNLLGGRLLHWVDIAGALAATRHARKAVATVAIESVDFRHPIRQGEMVMLSARVIWAGRTSMHVAVRVRAENLYTGAVVTTNEAHLTYVAMDENQIPCPVPGIVPVTEDEIRVYEDTQAEYERARARRQAQMKEEMKTPEISYCQSCGMPFDEAHRELIAKEADGRDSVYCTYCYKDGAFVNPAAAAQDMIEMGVPHLARKIGETAARERLSRFVPTLKRWKGKG